MSRVLIILGEYLSGSAQNGICIAGIANELRKRDIVVDILCYKDGEKKEKHVFTIEEDKFPQLSYKYLLNMITHPPIAYKNNVNRYIKAIKNLNERYNYDAAIAVVNPAETAQALMQIEKEHVIDNTLLYEIDPVSNKFLGSHNLAKIIYRKMVIRWEKKIYRYMKKIIHMKSHKEHFISNYYKGFINKSAFMDIPNFFPVSETFRIRFTKEQRITMIYAGAFYPNLREPKPLIDFLKALSKMQNISCNIYTDDRMKYELMELLDKKDNPIILNQMITNDEVMKIMSDSDLLLSIGNKASKFLPSKIFTYMSLGKPIIHIIGDSKDTVIPYLEKYPAALLLNPMDAIENQLRLYFEFIEKVNGMVIKRDTLFDSFFENTPAFTAEKFRKLLDL